MVTLPLCVVVASDVVDVGGEVTASVLLTKLLSVAPVVDVMVSLKLSVRTVEVVLMVCWFSGGGIRRSGCPQQNKST